MGAIPQFRYEKGEFTPFEYDLGKQDEKELWDDFLARNGWKMRVKVPGHTYHDVVSIQCWCWEKQAPHADAGRFYVEVMMEDENLVQVFCPNVIEFLGLLRDWLRPLVNGSDRDMLADVALEFQEILLNGERGLKCAQEFKRAKWADERARMRQREIAEKAKAG